MTVLMPRGLDTFEPMDGFTVNFTYSREQADEANQAFDEAVRQFLRRWLTQGTAAGVDRSHENPDETEQFIETGALRSFFRHHDDALERLLDETDIARHLLRPAAAVYFEPDAYEPLLAPFEKRIYNLSAHREHREVPFRYSARSRQGEHGDSIALADTPDGREDIGLYFGTRRSDETALNLLARELRREALFSTGLPIHIVTEGYMDESLQAVRTLTEQLAEAGHTQLQCFIIQRRHAADDRHLGAALLLMNPADPARPQRVIFCDTLNPHGQPPWWDKFRHRIDRIFPQPDGQAPVSARLEDGGVNLQRLHDGVPVRHQDIDCAFYTASMARALVQLARLSPELIVSGSIDALVSAMTARMPEYFVQANVAKAPAVVREVNVGRRWQTGQQALADLCRAQWLDRLVSPASVPPAERLDWEPAEPSSPGLDLSVAA